MHCPFCAAEDTKVIDSRLVTGGAQVRRRRECGNCRERFTTYESAELLMPHVVKSNGVREPFNEQKLRTGLKKALEKRPVSVEQIEEAIDNMKHSLRATGEREIDSGIIGEAVIGILKKLDAVAYVRFASVYRQFEDISEFREELDRLESK